MTSDLASPEPPQDRLTRDEWLQAFSELLGVNVPSSEDVDALLSIAGMAAHESERTAAPIACYLVGRSDIGPTAVLVSMKHPPE